jgi:hypothetical protein
MINIIAGGLGFIVSLLIWSLYEEIKRAVQYKKMKQEAIRLENERRERFASWTYEQFKGAETNGIPAHIVATRVLVNGWDKKTAVNTPVKGMDSK